MGLDFDLISKKKKIQSADFIYYNTLFNGILFIFMLQTGPSAK